MLFPPRNIFSTSGNPLPIVDGRLPEMWFSVSPIVTRDEILKIPIGIDPLNSL